MGYLRLLQHRPVLLLWVAQTLSVLGDRLYALAVMWLVWQATVGGAHGHGRRRRIRALTW